MALDERDLERARARIAENHARVNAEVTRAIHYPDLAEQMDDDEHGSAVNR